jgi:hypothetical protein
MTIPMVAPTNRGIPVGNNGSSLVVLGPARRRRKFRRFPITRHLLWSGLLRVIQKITGYKRDDRLEFKIGFSVRDLLSDKGRVVKDQVGAIVHVVQKAGSYPAKEDANRAIHAVVDALKDRVPPEMLTNLSESPPVREAARLSRATAQRLRRNDAERNGIGPDQETGDCAPSGKSTSAKESDPTL